MTKLLTRFVRDEEAQDLVEYALLLTLIAVALVTAIGLLTGAITAQFDNVRTILT